MKKLMAVAGACLLAACNSGTVTGPDPVETVTQAPEPVAAATPAPQPVVPPPSAQHDARVKGGFYSVTNETSVPQFYCAAAFGVLPGGEQGAGTNLYEDQGIRQSKDVFSGQAPKTAACQYKQIQVDLTQSKDCRKFDWHNVLAAEVYDNPGYIKDSETETLPDEYTYEYAEGQSAQNWCGSRTKITWSVKKYRCSGQVVKTEKSRTPDEGTPCCKYPQADFKLGTLNYPTYTPAVLAVKVGGYEFGNNSNGNRDACLDNGGAWHHFLKFCQIAKHFGNTWDDDENLPGKDEPQSDGDWRDSFTITPAIPASGGNPISGSATVSGAGVWKLVLKATDPGNYEKDVETKTLTCNSEPFTLTVSYSWIGHSSDDWQLLLYKDNVLVASSAVVNNPSN